VQKKESEDESDDSDIDFMSFGKNTIKQNTTAQ